MIIENTLFHVTPLTHLSSILRDGLLPSNGPRSKTIKETGDRVFLFNGKDALEEGVDNWLGDQFDELEPLVILSIDTAPIESQLSINIDCAYEVTSDKLIPPPSIKSIQTEDFEFVNLQKDTFQSYCDRTKIIVNHSDFGIRLELFANENLSMITQHNGCGWNDGGCLIFARALQLWSHGSIDIGAVVGQGQNALIDDHFVGICKVSNDYSLFFDASGLGTKNEVMRNHFIRPAVDIVSRSLDDISDDIPRCEKLSRTIAARFEQQFGPFHIELFPTQHLSSAKRSHGRLSL